MSFHSRLSLLQSAPPVRSSTPGPCFRTDSEGRIAVINDWPRLFSAARRFDAIALQTRHAYVRLIHIARAPEINWSAEGATEECATGCLRFMTAQWREASGRLAECACCGTPGRVEILNEHGLDFLQLCALPDCPPADWGEYLLEILAHEKSPAGQKTNACAALFPVIPPDCIPLSENPLELLPNFFATLADAALPFSALLQTPELVHLRELQPHRVMLHGGIITVQAINTTLQIGLPAVRGLALTQHPNHGAQLHLTGANRALLLTLNAASNEIDAERWQAVLRTVFPDNS